MSLRPFPMLAAAADLKKIQYPVLGFPKIDGIRAVIHNRQALSRKLIALPNQFIQGFFSNEHYQGLDGELVVGSATDPLCIKHSTSGVMSRDGAPDFTFYVFDKWDETHADFGRRFAEADSVVNRIGGVRLRMLEYTTLWGESAVLDYEADQLEQGYEGIILRDPRGAYKHGRSTVREGGLLKLKRFSDSEAEVLEVIEEQFNGNEAQKDNLGRTKRSSAKAGKVGKGRAGALRVRDLTTGVEFEVGTGLTDADKAEWWAWWLKVNRAPGVCERVIRYKFFSVGMQERPRHPVFVSMRDARDL